MKISIIWILLVCNNVFGQFNTIGRISRLSKKIDIVSEKDNQQTSLDSLALQQAYSQFLGDKSGDYTEKMSNCFFLPLQAIQYTSLFGQRFHPLQKVWKVHNGVDLKAFYEPVFAVADGTVKTVAYGHNEGYYVVISHGEIESVYCHLSIISVKVGQFINGGNNIGISGNSGQSTGPHLHFSIKFHGVAVDPAIVLFKSNTR